MKDAVIIKLNQFINSSIFIVLAKQKGSKVNEALADSCRLWMAQSDLNIPMTFYFAGKRQ